MAHFELVYLFGGIAIGLCLAGLWWWADASAQREAERRSTESSRRMFR